MFADDTNLFYKHKDIKVLFDTVNKELENINEWFISNRLSLNVKKTNYSLFHKPTRSDDLPLLLPKLYINNQEIKRAPCTKFLGVLLDENLSWKEHIKYTENKIAKNIGLMYKAKPFLDKESLLSLYFSYIHSYVNYANLVWGSTHRTNLKKIHSQQKHALRIIYNKDKYFHTKELFKDCNILNVYKLNLFNISIFMHKVKSGTSPSAFDNNFEIPSHSYPTRFSHKNYTKPKMKLKKCRFRISIRGPTIWNDFIGNAEKELDSTLLFKARIKSKLQELENVMEFF